MTPKQYEAFPQKQSALCAVFGITEKENENSTGRIVRRTFKGRDAIVVQHELDHLEGRDV